VLFVGMAETLLCCLWEWQGKCGRACGDDRENLVLFVGIVETIWSCLWDSSEYELAFKSSLKLVFW